MTINRASQICLEETPYYHCYVRCVRRAYLCGEDGATGESFDHRKQWIVSRLRFLSFVYAIDICAYAVMSNHYHVVLHVDKARAEQWTREEVAERWMQLYEGHMLVDRWLANPNAFDDATLETVFEIIEKWRERLYEIGWFMRGVNEKIARMANAEEGSRGRFWEGRYKSQALLDEAALLSCMAYVDLNPVRAAMSDELSDSDFTSIQQRLFDFAKRKVKKSPAEKQVVQRVKSQQRLKEDLELDTLPEAPLMEFDGSAHTDIHTALPFTQEDYIALVDCTGRAIRDDKRGFIAAEIPPIIARFGIDPDQWIHHVKGFGKRYGHCVGSIEVLANYAKKIENKWVKGVGDRGDLNGARRAAVGYHLY